MAMEKENEPLLLDEKSPLLTTSTTPAAAAPGNKPKCYSVGYLWKSLVFGWFTPVLDRMREKLSLGISPDLEDEDFPLLPPEDSTTKIVNEFQQLWRDERAKRGGQNPSLALCLWKAFSPLFLQAGVLKAFHDCLQFVGPQVLNGLIEFLRTPSDNLNRGLILTFAVTMAQLCMSLCLRHYFFMCYRVSLRIRTALLSAIYQKALTIDSSYYQDHPIGQVTNLMSVDTQRIQDIITYLHAIWYSFLQIGLSLYFLWQQLGPSCLAGVFVIILSIPLTAVTASWMGRLQKRVMVCKDNRIQTNQETVSNMKIVKLQAWEVPFTEKITELRRLELRQLLMYMLGGACNWLTWSAVPLLIALGTFGVYVTIAGHVLDVASALTALALFNLLRFPLFMLPNVINNLVEGNVAIRRIENFLNAPDQKPPLPLDSEDKVVEIKNGSYTYQSTHREEKKDPTVQDRLDQAEKDLLMMKAKLADAEDQLRSLEGSSTYGSTSNDSIHGDDAMVNKILSLKRVNFECKEGEFVVVVGGVGCGKSSLLRAILGEVGQVSGETKVRGRIAYFDQKPFIMNDTVKGNILFGRKDYDDDLYKLALKVSSLEHDLALLPQGDMCEIGEKGITLSGGQKARIAIARAVYQNPSLSLLDDCLSAVDAHVGRDLFDKCIIDTLLEGKNLGATPKRRTVVLVTNALQYLSHPKVDRIVVLKHGRVVESGSYKTLSKLENSHFKSFLKAFTDSMTGDYNTSSTGKEEIPTQIEDVLDGKLSQRRDSEIAETAADTAKQKKLMSDEMAERAIGKVGGEVYLAWVNAAGGLWVLPLIFVVFAVSESTNILTNWWLTYWSHSADTSMSGQVHSLAIYALISLSSILTDFLCMATNLLLGLTASKKLFTLLLDSIMAAPMSFFDTTPAGRIMNRFSKDIYTVDEALPMSFRTYLNCIFRTASTLVVVTTVTPKFAMALIPLLYFYRQQQAYFSQCYRELKRIDSVARSPIYALFGETLEGPATVRAFGSQQSLFDRMNDLVDHQQHAFYLTQAGLSWLAVRLELVGTFIVTGACLAAVLEKRSFLEGDSVFAGLAGLSISYALGVTQTLNWAVRIGSDFEANMVSIERIRQYFDLEREAPRSTDVDKELDESWPAHGAIEFQDSKLRYRPGLPLVLKGLNLTIPSTSKVGIVGRTGAGKSTLMTALMRLVELDGGSIVIDGVDIKTLGLQRLRSSIAVIPQDPVLFSGSVRTNLDPFSQHSDDELIDSLKRVGLWTTEQFSCVKSLNDDVMQNGENFSVGQRQLLVIARALLDGARIVICDEATAAIDAEADARIQKVLRTDFASATTLTVAHRLNTIMDSSHILVMSDGQCAEFDTPSNLLNRKGMFKDLVDKWEEEHK